MSSADTNNPIEIEPVPQPMEDDYPYVWRSREGLVVGLGQELPPRCVKCNEPTNRVIHKTYRWHKPFYYVVVLINVIVYIIVAAIVSKKASINIPICDKHYNRRRNAILTGWVSAGLGVIAFILAGILQSGWPVPFGILLMFGGLIYGAVRSQLLTVKSIDDYVATFGKVCPAFLDQLPDRLDPVAGCCPVCGYDLGGKKGVCPDCGTKVK